MDISKVKQRLNSLRNKDKKSDLLWKPAPGKQVVRIVPYTHNAENPFIELKFHYNLNGKTFLSPDTFNKPDPIVEFANKLKKSGDKEEWQFARKLEPKMRTFCPVIVRGREKEGVKFWGFGKQVYQAILSYIADPDYGDITDPNNGRDIVVEFRTAEETGKSFPETTIRPKPNQTAAVTDDLKDLLDDQTDILELFELPSYDDLKVAMDAWLNDGGPEADGADGAAKAETTAAETTAAETPATTPVKETAESKSDVKEETVQASTPSTKASSPGKENMDAVMKDFDKLFDS
jgi:hypothetical protein